MKAVIVPGFHGLGQRHHLYEGSDPALAMVGSMSVTVALPFFWEFYFFCVGGRGQCAMHSSAMRRHVWDSGKAYQCLFARWIACLLNYPPQPSEIGLKFNIFTFNQARGILRVPNCCPRRTPKVVLLKKRGSRFYETEFPPTRGAFGNVQAPCAHSNERLCALTGTNISQVAECFWACRGYPITQGKFSSPSR